LDSSDLIYCDNHLLVVNKSAGLLVQGDKSGDPSLLDYARGYLKERYNKPGNVYVGLVHRLDRPVSGVIALARTSKSASRLSGQFRDRTVRKIYHALVEGELPEEGHWLDKIVREGVTSRITESTEALRAELSFRRLNYIDGISRVEIDLATGRHHQIRVQFSSRGYPILGDFRYGSKVKFGEKTLALHARSLTIIHPTKKEEMTFLAEYPESWENFTKIK